MSILPAETHQGFISKTSFRLYFLLTTRVALSFSHDRVALQHEGLEEYIYRFFKHCLRRSKFKVLGEKFVTRTTLRLPSLTVFFHCMRYLMKMEYGWSLLLTDYPATWQKVTSKSKTFRCFYSFFFFKTCNF